MKKLAIVFDDLIQNGGAEKLLIAAHEIWPDAPIYTCIASKSWIAYTQKNNIMLITSFMQKLPFAVHLNKVLAVFGFHILAYESFSFDEFDTVFSLSARFAHGIITKPTTTHICYMHSPGRMFWESHNYFSSSMLLSLLLPFLAHMRAWDYSAAQRVDKFITNSQTSQKRIKKYYGRTSTIVYPFADIILKKSDTRVATDKNYFLLISRLVSWKRIDLAIKACLVLGRQLKIIGEGDAKWDLQKLSGNSKLIEFCGRVSDSEKLDLLLECTALIQTQYEDFGITCVEAMACGKPVIAYARGGALETVLPGVTGEFFDEQNVESLSTVFRNFDETKYSVENCIKQGMTFSRQRFIDELTIKLA